MGLAMTGCAALNPAFGDDQESDDGTGGVGESAAVEETSSAATTGATATGSSATTDASSTVATTYDPGTSSSGEADETQGPDRDWWDEDYAYRIRLEFVPRPGDLLDFVALTPITAGNAFEGLARDQLAFVDPVTQTRVGAEIANFEPTRGLLNAWVQVPHWHSDEPTELYLYFGPDAPASPHPNPWFDYMAVWHFDEYSMSSSPDSAGNANAVPVGAAVATPAIVPGRIGNGLEFDGVADRYRAVLPFQPPDDRFLVSGWLYADEYADAGSLLLARGGNVGTLPSDTEWLLRIYPKVINGRAHDDADGMNPTPSVQVSSLSSGQWHHYALRFDGESVVLYTNGNRRVSGPAELADFDHTALDVSLGGYALQDDDAWTSRLVDGVMDEVRWRIGGDVSDEWIERLFANQDNPEADLSVGPIETL